MRRKRKIKLVISSSFHHLHLCQVNYFDDYDDHQNLEITIKLIVVSDSLLFIGKCFISIRKIEKMMKMMMDDDDEGGGRG